MKNGASISKYILYCIVKIDQHEFIVSEYENYV